MTEIKPEQIRWRVGSLTKDQKKGMLLGYIDSRTAMELLDGEDAAWSDEYRIVRVRDDEGVECALTVNGVTRTDVGMPSNTEGLKGAYSDALKRAAVKHGIGRELYELPRIWVTLDEWKRPTAEPTYRNGRWTLPSGSGSVVYDHEPNDAPEQRGGERPSSPRAAPAPRTAEEQMLLDMLVASPGMSKARLSLLADAVGVPKGERANADQLRQMLAAIETPEQEGSAPEPATTQAAGEVVPPAASSEPAPARTLEEAIADAEAKAGKPKVAA